MIKYLNNLVLLTTENFRKMEKSSQQKASFGQGLELAIIILKAFAAIAKKIGPSSSEIQKFIDKPGTIYKCVENLFSEGILVKQSVLKLISTDKNNIIELPINKLKYFFKYWVIPCFKSWVLFDISVTAKVAILNVYEIVTDATFVQIFSELNSDLDKLIITKAQINRICKKHPSWLCQEGCPTFFLTKVKGKYSVIRVYARVDDLDICKFFFDGANIWRADDRCRVVVPQIKIMPV